MFTICPQLSVLYESCSNHCWNVQVAVTSLYAGCTNQTWGTDWRAGLKRIRVNYRDVPACHILGSSHYFHTNAEALTERGLRVIQYLQWIAVIVKCETWNCIKIVCHIVIYYSMWKCMLIVKLFSLRVGLQPYFVFLFFRDLEPQVWSLSYTFRVLTHLHFSLKE